MRHPARDATIMLAVASSARITDLVAAIDAAVNAGATVVSMSWGGSEFSSESTYESHFTQNGVTFLASSGDNGAGPSWPAASPSVVSVGGTSLSVDSVGNRTSTEVAWSGSGAGFSGYFSRPAYQNNWQSYSTRAFPDVSLVADPNTGVAVYNSTSYQGQKGWFQVGGTSASCPMWAAIIALANEQRVKATPSKPTLTGSDAALYAVAAGTGVAGSIDANFFFDITLGSNGYSAGTGYDEVTGLGTPKAVKVVPGLAAW
jgi:subtilase family serine protease